MTPYDALPLKVRRENWGWFGEPWWSYVCYGEDGRDAPAVDVVVAVERGQAGEPAEAGGALAGGHGSPARSARSHVIRSRVAMGTANTNPLTLSRG